MSLIADNFLLVAQTGSAFGAIASSFVLFKGLMSARNSLNTRKDASFVTGTAMDRTAQIRRYSVNTRVADKVLLDKENLALRRKPVSNGGVLGVDTFSDKTVGVTEADEETVIGKTTRVVEEVVVDKDAGHQLETEHDTVHRGESGAAKVTDVDKS